MGLEFLFRTLKNFALHALTSFVCFCAIYCHDAFIFKLLFYQYISYALWYIQDSAFCSHSTEFYKYINWILFKM